MSYTNEIKSVGNVVNSTEGQLVGGPLYLPIVGATSLASAAGLGADDHKTRWFEVHASRLGGKYFDRKYGSGRSDYFEGSPNHFDYNAFKEGGFAPYDNPRYLLFPNEYAYPNWNSAHYTRGGKFNFWDIGAPVLTFALVTRSVILIL